MNSDIEYKALFEHLSVAVLVLDSTLRIKFVNPAAEVLLGISGNRALDKSFPSHFRENDSPESALRQVQMSDPPFTRRRANWQLHNGRKITVDYTLTPLPEHSAMLLEVIALDRLLRISREEALLTAQNTSRNLVRSMAHEIKNPLGGIRGAAQLLARELPSPDLEEFTQIIIEETDRLRNLVDRMLGPRQPPKLAPTNPHEVLERVAKVIDAECGGNIVIKRDYDPSIPDVFADQDLLIQALLNIGGNAQQALQESDTENPSIILRTRVQRQFTIGRKYHNLVCKIQIEDNGPGIPPELIGNIFYPMITGRAEGTGLGLTISQHLIQQHHGLVECESRPGRTVFSIYLPLEQTHAR